jgi:hypothetical protein
MVNFEEYPLLHEIDFYIKNKKQNFLQKKKFFFYPIRLVTSAFFQSFVHKLIRSPLLRTDTTQPLTCCASSVY